ncbi:DUF1801 domain-containing protein [Flavobacterium sp.]|uniref:iron chaperone n=1 Tax=Flavobacterium sp. TaxID=239 RepID=UPI003264B575
METKKPENFDDYIGRFPNEVREILERIRMTIREAAPEAEEKISYSMPAIDQNGIIVYFAAFKNHIGLYALPTGHKGFKEELSSYKSGKGSVQFPLDKPIPYDLITKIVKFRLKENLLKAKEK